MPARPYGSRDTAGEAEAGTAHGTAEAETSLAPLFDLQAYLQSGWRVHLASGGKNAGRPYFYHAATKLSTWRDPITGHVPSGRVERALIAAVAAAKKARELDKGRDTGKVRHQEAGTVMVQEAGKAEESAMEQIMSSPANPLSGPVAQLPALCGVPLHESSQASLQDRSSSSSTQAVPSDSPPCLPSVSWHADLDVRSNIHSSVQEMPSPPHSFPPPPARRPARATQVTSAAPASSLSAFEAAIEQSARLRESNEQGTDPSRGNGVASEGTAALDRARASARGEEDSYGSSPSQMQTNQLPQLAGEQSERPIAEIRQEEADEEGSVHSSRSDASITRALSMRWLLKREKSWNTISNRAV